MQSASFSGAGFPSWESFDCYGESMGDGLEAVVEKTGARVAGAGTEDRGQRKNRAARKCPVGDPYQPLAQLIRGNRTPPEQSIDLAHTIAIREPSPKAHPEHPNIHITDIRDEAFSDLYMNGERNFSLDKLHLSLL